MSALTVTLTRAHKISERIGAAMKAAQTLASSTDGVSVRMTAKPTEDQSQLIKDKTAKVLTAVNQFAALARVQEAIRKAIARANVEAGVSDMLATIETNKRIIAMYAAVAAAHDVSADEVSLSSVDSYAWPALSASYMSGVSVTGMLRKDVEDMVTEQRELERQNFVLNDKLADLNARQITFEVPDALRAELGL
jgi:hypothetical protein